MQAKLKQSMLNYGPSQKLKKNPRHSGRMHFLEQQISSLNDVQIKNNRLPKNNSFDEKTSPIKIAIKKNMAPEEDEDDDPLMYQGRSRLISDGFDAH